VKVSCYRCGKTIKRKPNKLGSSGHAFCQKDHDNPDGCFGLWWFESTEQEKIDSGISVGRPSVLKERMAEFEEVVLTQRLKPQALADMFDIKKATVIWNRQRILAEHNICIREYNKEVRNANPKSYSPKMPKEFYLERYNKGYWDFDKNKWMYGTTKKELAKIAGVSEKMISKDLIHYKIERHKEAMPAGLDMKGKKFDLLRVARLVSIDEKKTGNDRYLWECKCDCGNKCMKSTTSLKYHYINCNTKNSCGCENKRIARWKSLDIDARHFNNIKSGAKKRKLEFDLTPEFLHELFHNQKKRSAISGRKLLMPGRKGNGSGLSQCASDNKDLIASLDRIDSSKGYTKDNVWWISRRENSCKMDLSIEDMEQFFIDGCEYLEESRRIRKAIADGDFLNG
tara:strand:+ start:2834 stop:4027 length:1194 start_codon:yes stop_codon:yes gene_type:complete